jgi:hypothetical protein
MRTTDRLLSRTNDQALAALSALMVVPRWRIGFFLIVPTVISNVVDMVPQRLLVSHNWPAGACLCQIFSTKSRPNVCRRA